MLITVDAIDDDVDQGCSVRMSNTKKDTIKFVGFLVNAI